MLIFQEPLGSARLWAHLNIGLTIIYVSICRHLYGLCYLPIYEVPAIFNPLLKHGMVLAIHLPAPRMPFPLSSFIVKAKRIPSWCRRRWQCQCRCRCQRCGHRHWQSPQEPAMISCSQTPMVIWIRRASNDAADVATASMSVQKEIRLERGVCYWWLVYLFPWDIYSFCSSFSNNHNSASN